jgi:endonuclease/exonuclease/phosphatase family metal-dependent hydrolase
VKVATLNLRADANRWDERFPLVVDVLSQTDADVIAVQEVRIKIDQHRHLADALNHGSAYAVYLCEDWYEPHILANAIFSRLPVIEHERVELPQGFRTAHCITVALNGQQITIANTHLHHKPYRDESIRLPQMRCVLEWLSPKNTPFILMGDINAAPSSETIQLAKQHLQSAYETIHGCEPESTFPTPLRDGETLAPRTIDYIFYTQSLQVIDARLIADKPHPDNLQLYPSDHYGLYGEIIAP